MNIQLIGSEGTGISPGRLGRGAGGNTGGGQRFGSGGGGQRRSNG